MCLALVCLPLIEDQLKVFCAHWNSHTIRTMRGGGGVGGIPDDLYSMPIHYGNVSLHCTNK